MKIELHEVTVRQVTDGYLDSEEEGVVGYGGQLDIRPKYQREFVYDEKKRTAVIETIRRDFPLNVMYWVVTDEGTYEVMDGQQRTISFCQYVKGDFSIPVDGRPMAFHNLPKTLQDQILDYKLMVYFCSGTDKEKLDWFRIINIAGERLVEQELRNAVYTGPWLTHAKSIFSKTNCAAYLLANKYVDGSPIRQDYLETAIKWLSGDKIEQYMSAHQHDLNANELWSYFQAVISWVGLTFTAYRKEMKDVDWGPLYDQFKDKFHDTGKLENEIKVLMIDDDVNRKKGIYQYVLTRDEKYLALRQFSEQLCLNRLARYEEAIAVINDQVRRFADATEPHVREWLAQALLIKHDAFRKSGQYRDPNADREEVVRLFSGATEPALCELVAKVRAKLEDRFDVGDEVRDYMNGWGHAIVVAVEDWQVNTGRNYTMLLDDGRQVTQMDEFLVPWNEVRDRRRLNQPCDFCTHSRTWHGWLGHDGEEMCWYVDELCECKEFAEGVPTA